jgi:hypothetical protein
MNKLTPYIFDNAVPHIQSHHHQFGFDARRSDQAVNFEFKDKIDMILSSMWVIVPGIDMDGYFRVVNRYGQSTYTKDYDAARAAVEYALKSFDELE